MKKKENNIFTNKLIVPFLAILASMLWGTAFPSLKFSYSHLMIAKTDFFSKMLFASYRFFLASLILSVFLLITRGKEFFALKFSEIKYLIILGLLQTTLQYFFFYNGLANTTGVKGSIINTAGIFLTVIVSHFIYHDDKLNIKKIMGLLFGFLGVIVVNLSQGSFDFNFAMLGEGFLIMAAIVSTGATIMAKDISKKIDPMLVTAYQMFLGSIALFFISIIKVSPTSLNFTPATIVILFYLAFVSAMAFALWYSLIKYNRLGYVTIYKFIVPVTGVLFSSLLLPEEHITLNVIIALIFVSSGIIMINYRKKKNQKIKQEI